MAVLQATSLKKVYGSEKGGVVHTALNELSLKVEGGEFSSDHGPFGQREDDLPQHFGDDRSTDIRFSGSERREPDAIET